MHVCYCRGTYLQALHWPQSFFLSLRRQPIHFPHRPVSIPACMGVSLYWKVHNYPLMSILGWGYAWYNYMHEKFTLPMENLVDRWCIHEWGNGRSERRWWEYDLPVLGTLLRSFGLYFSCWHWWYLYRVLLINFHCMHACVYVTSAQLESIYLQTRHVSSSRPTKLWLISMCVDNVWQSIHHSAQYLLISLLMQYVLFTIAAT